MLTFYLVRHGRTENNVRGITQGHIDSPLTEEGLKDAYKTSQRLKKIKFNHVYSSDLGRAFITAHIIVEQLGIESKLSRAKQLREINYGIYTNKKREEVKKEFPRTSASNVYPEGESFYQVQERAVKFIKHLEKEHPKQTLLIVTHGGVIRALKCHFNNWDFNDHLHMRITNEYIGKFVIEKGNLVSYEKINE